MRYLLFVLLLASCNGGGKETALYEEPHRPQIHFSPKAHWMNDPNGLVYYKGVYHMFFQYYPDSMVWGPMHWGHATSKDLVYWEEGDIALYPDSLGYIFSGSAVVDFDNTSGLGKDGKTPLVAIFTYHDPKGAEAKRNDYQVQGLAYSLDDGKTWTKYENNPVLKNPGIVDFRDPKVMWHEHTKKWIMSLATKDRISFYSSPDLKNWTKESEFGEKLGAHGGVWECPDLFFSGWVPGAGKSVYVLLVSINPGGPNGGSATQYFVGDFDGKQFTTTQTDTRWLDYGPDNYAGVLWSNADTHGNLFIGWMSNWNYGQKVPTAPWRSAMTVPRELTVEKVGDRLMVASSPVAVDYLLELGQKFNDIVVSSQEDVGGIRGDMTRPHRINFVSHKIQSFTITLSNKVGDSLMLGYDKTSNEYFIDRSKSGAIDFEKGFGGRFTAPRISLSDSMNMQLVIDNASIEMFADGGLTAMTAIFFPKEPYNHFKIKSPVEFKLEEIVINPLKSIWKKDTTSVR